LNHNDPASAVYPRTSRPLPPIRKDDTRVPLVLPESLVLKERIKGTF
jgi:hypothetical protein